MKDLPLISVIVPVYKAEAYLDRCFRSIVEQTYPNLEIILVDDGSPGNSGAICDRWAEKDSRISVIHKKNGGTGQARNAALDRARGELIAFLDCDDYLAPDMYSQLYSLMDDQTDIAECSFALVYDDDWTPDDKKASVTVCTAQEAMSYHIQDTLFRQIVWNKLYRRETIGDIRFVDGIRSDDEFFTYRVIGNARKLVHTSRELHAYRQQAGSVMHQKYALWNLEGLQGRKLRLDYLKANMPALVYEAKVNLFFLCIYAMEQTMLDMQGADFEKARGIIRSVRAELTPLAPSRKNSFSVNLWLILAQISFDGVCKLQNYLSARTK